MIERLNYIEINKSAINGLMAAKKSITAIDKKLIAIIELRVSQINGCAYCVDLHAHQARLAGETQQRLDCMTVWDECGFFEPAECSALAWAEAVTYIAETAAPPELYENLSEHFSDEQIVDITHVAAQMNAWNRLAISFRHLPDLRK